MPIAGAAAGASQALEKILAEQMLRAQQVQREREAQAQMQMRQQELNAQIEGQNANRQLREREIDLTDRSRRDRINREGLETMQHDRARMDEEQILSGLNPKLRTIAGLRKVGVSGVSPEDMDTPEERAQRDQAAIDRAGKIAGAQAKAAAQYRNDKPVEPRVVTMPDGSIKDLNNVLPPGAVPYDQVAARSSKPEDKTEAADTAREASRLASELLQHKGFSRAFGTIDAFIPPVFSQDKADASSIRDALTSMLTLENMGKMKGVLSDSDMKVLRQASTTLNAQMSEGAARKELERIVEVMGKVGAGQPAASPGGVPDAAAAAQALIERTRKARGGKP